MKCMQICAACASVLLLTACNNTLESTMPESLPADSALAVSTADIAESTQTDTQSNLSDNSAVQQTELSAELFTAALEDIDVSVSDNSVTEHGTTRGQDFSLTIDLSQWEQYTSPEQMVTLSQLFWQCYPKMYARYADLSDPPTDVVLAIENTGYEIAEAGGNFVHLHDKWLWSNPEDYDCITHELAHIIQNGWDEAYLEDSGFIERFADCCRYEYALNDGYYNDGGWTLHTPETESSRGESVRFFVWLDFTFSGSGTDIMRNFFDVCRNMTYSPDQWDDAWAQIFAGTALEGKTADEVWAMYTASDFANLSSYGMHGEVSDLLQAYPVRIAANTFTVRPRSLTQTQ